MSGANRQAVIVDGLRTPFGRAHEQKGVFRATRADELAAHCLRALIARNNLDPQLVDDVIIGAALQLDELSLNAARQIALLAGLPVTCPAVTVNRLCGSSLQALHQAVHAIEAGAADVQIVAGVERMTGQLPPSPAVFHPQLSAVTSRAALSMGLTAEFLAQRFRISRAEQDAWALRSHQLAAAVHPVAGLLPEILPTPALSEAGTSFMATTDQGVRADTSLAALAKLPPAFLAREGTITAGNSSPRNDGAAALLVMSAERARALGYQALARVRATTVVGISPSEMGLGPVPAIAKALHQAQLSLCDLSTIELNEAFAAQTLACIRQAKLNPSLINGRGGAIAIGHPLGASGARLIISLIHSLHLSGGELGLAAMCIGMGQGIATVIERS
ncbi:3-ketoacyl-CoA thiolase [Anatilimnocola aggregata]|uniref:acetyl-CoA C-acyltransferase n=1 Tax=Anatilimnocola aggregata TaxID=2528021 RepID=A0A517Y7D6_9BACT|nr:thiolase family protein [Anatilimnocola aggregata]QDU26139.1 3-ketoacyl-CoA thiolase [Anatilimnocola aggregata]